MSIIEKDRAIWNINNIYVDWFLEKIYKIDYHSIYDEVVKSRVDTKDPRSIWFKIYNSLSNEYVNSLIHVRVMMCQKVDGMFKLDTDLKTFISENIDETIDTKIDLLAYNNDKLSDDTTEKVKSAIKRQAESWIYLCIADNFIEKYTSWFIDKLMKEIEGQNSYEVFHLRMLEINPDIKDTYRLWHDIYYQYFVPKKIVTNIYSKLWDAKNNGKYITDLKKFISEDMYGSIDAKIDLLAYNNDKLSADTIEKIQSLIKRIHQFMIDEHFDEFRKMYF